MTEWLQAHPMTLAGLIVWAAGILWLMPGRRGGTRRTPTIGLSIAAAGIVLFCLSPGKTAAEFSDSAMFWIFATAALLSSVLMITAHNPVYAALWFALATLSTCGLFLLQSAPFLAAATIIVYAGAVIVTFLFVIMLAQQSGRATYDQKSCQGLLATVSAFILLGTIAKTLQSGPLKIDVPDVGIAARTEASPESQPGSVSFSRQPIGPDTLKAAPVTPNVLSKADAEHPVGNLKGLGRSLFSDYLFAVELAGTLLLIACIGAITIAPRREKGAL